RVSPRRTLSVFDEPLGLTKPSYSISTLMHKSTTLTSLRIITPLPRLKIACFLSVNRFRRGRRTSDNTTNLPTVVASVSNHGPIFSLVPPLVHSRLIVHTA